MSFFAINERAFTLDPEPIETPAPFWLAVAKQNWEAASRLLDTQRIKYNYAPQDWRISPKATAIEMAIAYGKWDFASKMLQKYPNALIEGFAFNQDLHGNHQLHMEISADDEYLVLEILQNRAVSPNFVSLLVGNAAFKYAQPRWEFLKSILNNCSDDILSSIIKFQYVFLMFYPVKREDEKFIQFYNFLFDHAQEKNSSWLNDHVKDFVHMFGSHHSRELLDRLLYLPGGKGITVIIDHFNEPGYFPKEDIPYIIKKILALKTDFSKEEIIRLVHIGQKCDESLLLEMFKRYPTTEIDSLFFGNRDQNFRLFQLAKEFSFVKEVLRVNKKHLMESFQFNLYMDCSGMGINGSLELLKEALGFVPDCDIHLYAEETIKCLHGSPHPKIKEAFRILLDHAKGQNDQVFLEKYSSMIT